MTARTWRDGFHVETAAGRLLCGAVPPPRFAWAVICTLDPGHDGDHVCESETLILLLTEGYRLASQTPRNVEDAR